MKDQLSQYVSLLFAGTQGTEDIRQEILQNTLDRYDDLVSQGKSPEAAYRLAISGIGDISEILGESRSTASTLQPPASSGEDSRPPVSPLKKVLRAVAVLLYILCPIPLFVLSELDMDTIGLCGTIAIVAIATAMIMLSSSGQKDEAHSSRPRSELEKSIHTLISVLGVAIYLAVSFATSAWYITWVIFPMIGVLKAIVTACSDLKEAVKHEK